MRRIVKRITRVSTTTSWTVTWETEVPPAAAPKHPAREVVVEQKKAEVLSTDADAQPNGLANPDHPDAFIDQGDHS
jgi:hypothetical protein